jgi:trigger factor
MAMTESAPEQAVSVEQLTEVQRKLAVEIPWDQVKGKLDEAYQELGRGVTIKGFRRGKVPRRLLQQMFGQHVHREVAQQLVQESIAKAVSDNDLSPISEPEVEQGDIVDGEAFRYSAVLQVLPEIEPKDYDGLEVPRREAKVTDDEIERALRQKQQEATEYRSLEGRLTQEGDVLLVDVLGKVGDEPLSLESEFVELGGESPREPVPGLGAKLTGIPSDQDELEIELEVPGQPAADESEGAAAMPARTARLLVTVKDVKERFVPELDDEFAKDTGEADTLDELREKVRQQLLEADEQRAIQEAREKLTSLLLERNEVPVVPALIERQLEQMTKFQQLLFGDQSDPEQLKEQLRPEAEKTVRSALLVRAIGKKEEVEVQEADVEKRLAEMAAARGQNSAKVRSEYEKEGRLEQLRESIREEKTLDLLMSKSNLIIQKSAETSDSEANADESESGQE